MTTLARPSTFVTVLAWLALVFSGMATATGLLQSAMVAFLMPVGPLSASDAAQTPPVFRFLFEHFLAFVVALTAVWAATFTFAVGLLRRNEWGRRGFMGILAVWCVATVIATVVQQLTMSDLFSGAQAADVPADARSIILAMRLAGALFGVAFAGCLGWLTWQLSRPHIRAEFGPAMKMGRGEPASNQPPEDRK